MIGLKVEGGNASTDATPQMLHLVGNAVHIRQVFRVHQVALQVGQGAVILPHCRVGKATVAVLGPGVGHQDHQALLHGQQARPVACLLVNLFQVAQHARQDIPLGRGLQIERQWRVLRVGQASAAAIGKQHLLKVFTAQGLTVERVDHGQTQRQLDLDQEMTGKTHAMRGQTQGAGQFQPNQRQRNRDTDPALQHFMDEAVGRVVIVIDIAAKTQVLVKEPVQGTQARKC